MATRMDMDTGRVDRADRGTVWPWVLLAIAVIAAVIWWASTMANNNAGMGGMNSYQTSPGIGSGGGVGPDYTTAPGSTTGGPVPGTGGVR
jgi:hypothetical protein